MNGRWSPFTKQIIVVGSLVASVWLLSRVSVLLMPLILALLLAYLVSLPVNWIVRRTGWPRTLVAAVTYLILLVLIITAPVLLVPRLVSLVGAFGATLVNVIQELTAVSPKPITITPDLTIDLGLFYAPIDQWLQGALTPDSSTLQGLQALLFPFATGAAAVVRGAVSGVLWTIFVLAISFYLVKDAPLIGRFIFSRLPEPLRPEMRRLWTELGAIWDASVRGHLIMGLTMGIIVWLATSLLGIRSAPALGLLSGLMEFVPGVGPVVGAIPGFLIALILGSTWLPLPHLWFAMLVALVYFLITQFEGLYVLPRVVGRRVFLHPVVVITGALAGAEIGGVLGILLAAPTIASIRMLFGYAFHKLLDEEPFPPPEAPPERGVRSPVTLGLWQGLIRSRPVGAVLFDLDGTLIETDDALVKQWAGRLRFLQRWVPQARLERAVRRLLMASETPVNGFVTLLDRLHLDGLLFKLSSRLRRLRGIRAPENFVAVTGSIEMLRVLAQHYPLAVVTSRSREEAAAFLNQYGLDGLFRAVVTRDDSWRLKPHPMPVRSAARQLAVPVESCVMVGDTAVDVRAANAAGALAVGVLCGFGEQEDLRAADLVIASTAQLGAWL
jgi:HAD superfamily hydrolase (TIGR01549 family)